MSVLAEFSIQKVGLPFFILAKLVTPNFPNDRTGKPDFRSPNSKFGEIRKKDERVLNMCQMLTCF